MRKPTIEVREGKTNARYTLQAVAKKARKPYITIYMRYKALKAKKQAVTIASLTSKRELGRPVEA